MQSDSSSPLDIPLQRSRRWARFNPALVIWPLVILLLWWVLRSVSLGDLWQVLKHLTGLQILALLALNVLIAFAFGWRWWLILRALGFSLSYPLLSSYQLVCSSISYFTPGPHFGGEPLQVLLLNRRHAVPGPLATASVALDKLLEVLVNFSFLVVGVVITLQARIAPGALSEGGVAVALALLAVPLVILGLLYAGKHPISGLVSLLPSRLRPPGRLLIVVAETESHAIRACREHPGLIAAAVGGSVVVWAAMFVEFWLSTLFLGLSLDWLQLVCIVTVARVSLLLPTPGGLGTLEAGQIIVMQWLGFDPAVGLALSLIIRARDVLFGIIGLMWGAWLIGGWQSLWGRQVSE